MAINSFFSKYKLYHILFWVLLFGGWYYFRYEDFSSSALAFKMILVKVVDLAILVYVTNYMLIPQLLYKKKYVLFGVSYVLIVFGFSILKMYVEGQLLNRPDLFNFSTNLKLRIYDNIIPHFLLVSTGAAFKIMMDYGKAQRKLGEMAKEKAETELNFLKSQINPHFLFNSINSVYFLIDKSNTEARQALHKFSEMLRYQLYECSGDKIPIEKEVKYLKDYIDLQKLRKEENFFIDFTSSPAISGFLIEPLLLMPFVENSFKHISHFSNGRPNKVTIELDKENNFFHFKINNTTDESYSKELVNNGGIGLANVKRRLELLYPGKHTLSVDKKESAFSVELKIMLD
ncbi:MAG: histidine kinase [Chitinophagaceae bacterium]|nr:histidine kinase [Chitinophagaceae bacterium]